MDGRHPQNIDPQPKRRKSKDNPYTLFTTGVETDTPRYFLSFQGASMEIDTVLFYLLNQFELEDLSYMNEIDRHYEHSELTEETLVSRAALPRPTVDELVLRRIEHERLRRAIAQLPDTQRRRLVLYYFGSFTYQQIAEMEGCTIMPVKRSIDQAIKNLKNIFEKGG